MTEEQVTKAILKSLISNNWEIVCFDFPQSGTGRLLHPNNDSNKSKGSINPDIICVKDGVCLYFENKDRYYYPDYQKVKSLIDDNQYSQALSELLSNYDICKMYYGIGMPKNKYKNQAVENRKMVDFIIAVSDDNSVSFEYSKCCIYL